ncbi:hypothetical protein [Sulfurimonas sp.]|uniref:hypothetical protein n=1 Tax=Sulfurimonas sp. TaxID=2022749 RepID=UPI0026058176|nr:hypothetical protein [Sulfurimonas sp.]
MKKIMPYIVIAILVLVIVTVFLSLAKVQHMVVIKEGNLKKLPLTMQVHKFQDSFCGMVIDDLDYASQVIAPDGRTWFFHDHGDFVQWLEDKEFKDSAIIWVTSRDTHKWIDAKKAYYSLNETTPMGFGFGAYAQKKDGMIDFDTMRLKVLRGETLKNPKIRKQILGK